MVTKEGWAGRRERGKLRVSRRAGRGKKGPPGGRIIVSRKKIVREQEELREKELSEKDRFGSLDGQANERITRKLPKGKIRDG
jgi:hypothetical protein